MIQITVGRENARWYRLSGDGIERRADESSSELAQIRVADLNVANIVGRNLRVWGCGEATDP